MPETLTARRPTFDWRNTPLHWIPGDPYVTHWMNTLHLYAPVLERGLLNIYKQALPRIEDERLRADVRGLMAQEAAHSRAHEIVQDWLRERGLEPRPFVEDCLRAWEVFAGELPPRGIPKDAWLLWRLAVIVAGEHLTCVIGDWSITSDALEAAAADPEMLAMLRWHGAEEIEHRAVSFDVLEDLAGPAAYPLRVAAMLGVFPYFMWLTYQAAAYLLAHDPQLQGRTFGWADYQRMVERRLSPGGDLFGAVARYMHPGFHPDQEGKLDRAREVLAAL
jgi:hypothetical protein